MISVLVGKEQTQRPVRSGNWNVNDHAFELHTILRIRAEHDLARCRVALKGIADLRTRNRIAELLVMDLANYQKIATVPCASRVYLIRVVCFNQASSILLKEHVASLGSEFLWASCCQADLAVPCIRFLELLFVLVFDIRW